MSFKPWDERTSKDLQAQAILAKINGELATQIPEGVAFAFMPPSIPGLGSAGGFSLWLQDRSGGSVEFLDQNLQAFMAAARKRPELAGVMTQFSANVPQVYADVDRDKALKQGVAVADIYQTLQAYLGGLYLNQFNRFGRLQCLQSEGECVGRNVTSITTSCVTMKERWSRYQLCGNSEHQARNTQTDSISIAVPKYLVLRLLVTVQDKRYSALEGWLAKRYRAEIGYDWADLSYQERQTSGAAMKALALSLVFVFLILAATLYESWSLPFQSY